MTTKPRADELPNRLARPTGEACNREAVVELRRGALAILRAADAMLKRIDGLEEVDTPAPEALT